MSLLRAVCVTLKSLLHALCGTLESLLPAGSSRELFASSSRAGVSGTLHRIGAMKNSAGKVNGLTYRIGRHLPGEPSVAHTADFLQTSKKQCLLFILYCT